MRQSLEQVQERLRTAEGLLQAAEQKFVLQRGERAALQGQVDNGAPGCGRGAVAALQFWQTQKV